MGAEMSKFKVGDHVTRPAALDNGRWDRYGDKVLPGRLRRGVVVAIETHRGDSLYRVRWSDDPENTRRYFWHGLDRIMERSS